MGRPRLAKCFNQTLICFITMGRPMDLNVCDTYFTIYKKKYIKRNCIQQFLSTRIFRQKKKKYSYINIENITEYFLKEKCVKKIISCVFW